MSTPIMCITFLVIGLAFGFAAGIWYDEIRGWMK